MKLYKISMPEPNGSKGDGGKEEHRGTESADRAKSPLPPDDKIPDGVRPLFFSAAGQQVFECVVEQDVTEDNPHKFIDKGLILEDFKNRAAVSDFHPVKKGIQGYPGDQVLVVYDPDYKHGENFYVCLTEEAKEYILQKHQEVLEAEMAQEAAEEEEDEIPSTPEPKEWECLGSDKIIEERHYSNTRELVRYSFSRKRRMFGAQYKFTSTQCDDDSETCVNISSVPGVNLELQRMEMEIGVQSVPEVTDKSCQVGQPKPYSKAVQYIPLNLEEEEKQKILNKFSVKTFLATIYPKLDLFLQQNIVMNLFEDDYMLLSSTEGIIRSKSDTNLKEYQSFADLRFSKNKVISAIEWHPTIKGIVAVACSENVGYDERMDLSSTLLKDRSLVLIWSFADPIHPVLFLKGPESVQCFKFCPSNPNLIVGGCINGQVVLWNIQEHQDLLQVNRHVEAKTVAASMAVFDTEPKLDHAPMILNSVTSSIKDVHSREVMDIHWLPHNIEICRKTGGILTNPSHQCNQIVSCSIDGSVLVWDIRPPAERRKSLANQTRTKTHELEISYTYLDLVWTPFIRVPLPRIDTPGKYLATRVSIREKHTEIPKEILGSTVNMDITATGELIEDANTMFFVGTEDGEIAYCDWKPTRDPDSGKLLASQPLYAFMSHYGSISSVERSPFYRDIILTVDGCSWKLWKEGAQSGCLLSSFNSPIKFAGGAWSPTRPGVFFIIKTNGNVDVWDLMDRSHEPVLSQNISSSGLTFIVPKKLSSKQMMLAVGDDAGTLHILETPWNLSLPSNNEVGIMEHFFNHEEERLEFTAARMQQRMVEKKALDIQKVEASTKQEESPLLAESIEERAKKDFENYLALELKLLTQLGIVQSHGDSED